jgi:hypothetical protein
MGVMKMKQASLFLSFFIVFLSLSSAALAIGIAPPRVVIDFEPGLEREIPFVVLNNLDAPVGVQLYVKGELGSLVTLDTESVSLGPQETREFTALLRLPSRIDTPGMNEIRVGALETQANAGTGTVGAKAGVESQIRIMVPYEGKFLVASLEATDAKAGEEVVFTVRISNPGKEDIAKVSAMIDVYSGTEKAASVSTGSTGLAAGSEGQLTAEWVSGEAGVHMAEAVISYDGETRKAEATFNVGELLVEILGVSTNEFFQGDIARILIDIQSSWNEPIEDVYAEVTIGSAVLESKPITLEPMSEDQLEVFWDTGGIQEGEYQGNAVVHYRGETAGKQFTVTVRQRGMVDMWVIMIVIVLALVIAAVYISLFRWKR